MDEPNRPMVLMLSETQRRELATIPCPTMGWLDQLPSFTFLTVVPDDGYADAAERMRAAGLDVYAVAEGEWYRAWLFSGRNPLWDGTPRPLPDPTSSWPRPIGEAGRG